MGCKMWGVKVVALVVGLLVMVPETMQSTMHNPNLRSVVDRRINNNKAGYHLYLGLILSSTAGAKQLVESGYFVPQSVVHIAGREFNIGTFQGAPAIYVLTGTPLAAVSATVQILVDNFLIKGIISFGGAATISDKLEIGTVAVLDSVAYTGVWNWEQYIKPVKKASSDELPSLAFGEYNVENPGIFNNYLAEIEYQGVDEYTPSGKKEDTLFFPVNKEWLKIASEIQVPDVVFGVKGSSSDIYLRNEAYAKFLHDNLGVSTVDTVSAAVVSTARANGVPNIVFRAPTNKPGVPYDAASSTAANEKLLKVVDAFVERLMKSPTYY